MSTPLRMRRADKMMTEAAVAALLERAHCGRLATVSADGSPYCIPLLFVMLGNTLYVHTGAARGHLRTNIDRDPRICFEIDEPGPVFAYGRFECDSSIAFASIVLYGTARIIADRATKQQFCEALMRKYAPPDLDRPRGVFPRLDAITVYAIQIESMTGKQTPLPPLQEQWPAVDRTRTPAVVAEENA